MFDLLKIKTIDLIDLWIPKSEIAFVEAKSCEIKPCGWTDGVHAIVHLKDRTTRHFLNKTEWESLQAAMASN